MKAKRKKQIGIGDLLMFEAGVAHEKTRKWKALHSSEKQDWATPQWLFDALARRYGPFDIDVCASAENHKGSTAAYFDEELDGLTQDWGLSTRLDDLKRGVRANNVCWMNPPYGRSIGRWLEKTANEADKGCRVVCLVPSRTGSSWFREAAARASEIIFIVGRITFVGASSPAPFDSAVIIFEPVPPDAPGTVDHSRPYVRWLKREDL